MTTTIFSDDQLRDKDIDTLKRYLRYKLGGYRVALADIRTVNVLYRGVPWQQRPGKIDHVSYPPADKVTKLGRVKPHRKTRVLLQPGSARSVLRT
jgi:hypothetical protein